MDALVENPLPQRIGSLAWLVLQVHVEDGVVCERRSSR